ncbi:uncharacterized membrane protein (DUF373 family) [Povalibacter uvarum]|uniref:Uncharacterized membrane protein (DUF373 family) n=1 Tax=Povalibacter uvarum TaxID=732238 RepID=A0A841HSA1_9GAMM|nr:phosphate-starvation-inducible PsiE family protein [Povalibacter uvarum]MBB6095179.1 uncharacterized membrane protein (DUF373 family) [Povalibacter uvarum]
MESPRPIQKLSTAFETVIIVTMQLVLMLMIAIAVFELLKLIYLGIRSGIFGFGHPTIPEVITVGDLQRILQRAFGGVLLVLLGLELLDTLRSYFNEHRIRLEIILVVAVIAVGRHIILLDFERLDGMTLVGIGVLVIALTGGYYLVKRSSNERPGPDSRC